MNIRTILKNFSATVTANIISLIISSIVVLIVPKVLGVLEYSYWQLYVFYSAYAAFASFGWQDGVYLKYGGKEYDSLDKKIFHTQFIYLFVFEILILSIVAIIISIFMNDYRKEYILFVVCCGAFVKILRSFFNNILQATSRLSEFALITIFDRLIYLVGIIFLLLIGVRSAKLYIWMDVLGIGLSMLLSMYICKDIALYRGLENLTDGFKESIDLLSGGFKLMVANIASMLILGIIRISIEHKWGIEAFGKVSLTISISNMMMLCINAIGLVLFPIIRRTNQDRLSQIYIILRNMLVLTFAVALIFYYPIKAFMDAWLPEYRDSLKYMALIFPMCIFECKMALLINTYLKNFRKEKQLLKINLIALLFSIVLSLLGTIVIEKIEFMMLSIIIVLGFRCIIAEVYIEKILNIDINQDILLEMILVIMFVISGWFLKNICGFVAYTLVVSIYLMIRIRSIKKDFRIIMKNIFNK